MVRKKFDPSLIAIMIGLTLFAIIIILPFYNSVIVSLVTNKEYQESSFILWPKELTFQSYRFVLRWRNLYITAGNTLMITLLGVPYTMFITITYAYALLKPIPGRRFFFVFVMFTMFFGGGLVPFYLLMVDTLGLTNNRLAMVVPVGLSIWNMMLMQGYFRTISPEFEESARMDGAGEITIFARIVLPLCKPMLATIALFTAVGFWNEWFNGMLFMRRASQFPLQLMIRTILQQTSQILEGVPAAARQEAFNMGIQMAAVLLTIVPIAIVYPFLQKHFAQGITLGGVKG